MKVINPGILLLINRLRNFLFHLTICMLIKLLSLCYLVMLMKF